MANRWYIWTISDDPDTNECLVKEIFGPEFVERLDRDRMCSDGVKRNLYWCQTGYGMVRTVIAGIKKYNLKIEVFYEIPGSDPVQYNLWKKAVRDAARRARERRRLWYPSHRV